MTVNKRPKRESNFFLNGGALEFWLHSQSSLTQKIRRLFQDQEVHVELLSLKPVLLSAHQCHLMDLPLRQYALEREILLYADDAPLIYAKTHMPITSLLGEHRRLRMLGNRVLGDYVFTHQSSVRESLWVFNPINIVARGEEYPQTPYRSSLFLLSEKPILVTEYFLPRLIEKIHAQN